MRLKPEKIDDLAHKVVEEFKNYPDTLAFRVDEDVVMHEIKAVITQDLEREDELEEEVRRKLQQHLKGRAMRPDVSMSSLVNKAKRQLARERGLVL